MKAVKLISVILALATLCCMFIACEEEDIYSIELPERDFYDITVSFQIKDSTGRTVFDAVDYNYKGHEEPTILNIVSDYVVIEADATFKTDQNNKLVQIGKFKATARKGEYWAFMEGTELDVQSILASQSLQNKHFIDGNMSEYLIEDGGKFTIVLVAAE
jgi:hypothetical protein